MPIRFSPRAVRILLFAGAFLAGLASIAIVMVIVAALRSPQVTAAAIGGPFSLVDQNGQTITDADFKGRPFLVFFGFTHCPDVCPTTLFEVSEVLRALGSDAGGVRALFVTVDPERDTPAVLRDYLSSFDPRLVAATGSRDAVDQMLKAYRVYARKVPQENGDYTMDHTALVYLMDKDGRFVAPFNLKRSPEEAAADLRKYN
ncbi:MAG TPA: SCO family protein [Xanthobacteraceae bacterium]|nr:SCO family protein [Xanthobacteraceae bacterium]